MINSITLDADVQHLNEVYLICFKGIIYYNMNTRNNILGVILFTAALALGWLAGRYVLQETWTSPEHMERIQFEMDALREFIDSRCNGCTPALSECVKEREELVSELNIRCKNVITYAVTLEFENIRLNELMNKCGCSR